MSKTTHDAPGGVGSPGLFMRGSLLFGFGLGGLADGIVLHQVLQWHNLVSTQVTNETLGGLQTNLFWDGVFHLSTTVLVVIGVLLLWRACEGRDHVTGNLSARVGLVLVGWGAFHVVDQMLFHELLNLHNIREDAASVALYNWGFFAVGLVLAAVGWVLWKAKGTLGASSLR